MGKRGQGYVQGWALGKDARCEKIIYGEVSKWGHAQIRNKWNFGMME
jgi:hypothetical protein